MNRQSELLPMRTQARERARQPANPLAARELFLCCRHRVPVLSKLVRVLLHCDIYCDLKDSIVNMPHPYGIAVHSGARIGRGVTLLQQVTIGARSGVAAAVVIEDGVYIGAGAKVLGAIRIGRDATIGANAVVNRDVPPGATVVGANRIVRSAS